MDKDRLPATSRPGDLARSDPRGGKLERHNQVPAHSAGELLFTAASGSREELWERLGPKVHERVNAKLGALVEWWATEYERKVSAVALGRRALIVVKPIVNDAGRLAHKIESLPLDEASFRSVRVTEAALARPPGPSGGPGRSPFRPGGSRPGDPPSGQGAVLSARLGADMTGFLGHLPSRAQHLLQEPFLSSGNRNNLKSDNHYVRLGRPHAIGGAVLEVWCYLTDTRFVTFAAGLGHGYQESTGATSWELTCWRAEVAPRTRSRGG